MRIGIFGGAFNPVHNGHLHIADVFFKGLGLDKLILIPTSKPPHKTDEFLLDGSDRIKMLELATENKPYEISSIEFDRSEKSYTYDTLTELKKIYIDDELFLIIGSDQFLSFDKWYRYRDILDMAVLCTSAREDETERLDIINKAEYLGIQNNFYLSDKPLLKVSSSEIRDGLKNCKDVSALLPPKVLNYILEKGLYCV